MLLIWYSFFLAVLGLRCCMQAFSGCSAWVSDCRGFSLRSTDSRVWLGNCDPQSLLSHSMWNPPRSGIKPMSSSLAGGFLTTGPPGKFYIFLFLFFSIMVYHRILNKVPWAIQWDLVVYPQDLLVGLFSPRIKQITGLKRKSNDFLSVVLWGFL